MRNAMQYMKKHPNFIILLLGDKEKPSASYKIQGLRGLEVF